MADFTIIRADSGQTGFVIPVVLRIRPLAENAKLAFPTILFKQSETTFLPTANAALRHLLRLLREHPSWHISIEGHTENRGRRADLQQLSEARAAAVRDYLRQRGIAANRLQTVGYGGTQPLSDGPHPTALSKNRRVEIRLTRVE